MKKLVAISILVLLGIIHEEAIGLMLLIILSTWGLIAILNADQHNHYN